jgi:hypothetical protein
VAKSLGKLLQSDRMWKHVLLVVRAVFPVLLLLRLADKKQPGMDRLYFYVRRMDEALKRSRELLDEIEQNYTDQPGTDCRTQMIQYFLGTEAVVSTYTNELDVANEDDGDDSDEDNDSDAEDELVDDLEDRTNDEEAAIDLQELCGTKVYNSWTKRSKALRPDIAIAGWMCSPDPEIMKDVKNHTGDHLQAVERMLRKWYSHEVRSVAVRF